MSKGETPKYTRQEEWANILTHAAGVVFSIAAIVILVRYSLYYGDTYHMVSVSVFGASLVLLYLASTIYHAISHPEIKHVFRIVDHACIFILIAGSYTPFMLVNLRGGWGWSLFGVIWGLAFFGILFKILFVKRFQILSTMVYVGMGWLIIVAIKPAVAAVPAGGMLWLLAGGLLYTGGTAFYLWKQLPYNHAIWHLFVMGGSFCHFLAILLYAVPNVI